MAIFLTDAERALINAQRQTEPLNRFYWGLLRRAQKRAASPGLINETTTVEWWHTAAEYVTDGAMAFALQGDETVGIWVRDVALSLARRSVDDWVGPDFRDHVTEPPLGHLETAHLSLATAAALDLAPEVFTAAERDEIAGVLAERAIPMCARWLAARTSLNNWGAILNSGLAVAAAVVHDRAAMDQAADFFRVYVQAFQPDGSYSESLQYGNYAAQGLMIAYEALVRRDPAYAETLSILNYARAPRWAAYSLLYVKPLSGWGAAPMPRSANFNDSAAMHRPTADLLLHIAARAGDDLPLEAGLARWLFETRYVPYVTQKPFDRMSFGFFNHFGFLTLPLLPQAPAPISPTEADLPTLAHFSCGDTLVRNQWDGRTILAVHGGGDPLYAPGHLHGDLNSFILTHNQERLLLDPGHSCYRNLIRELDIASQTHNTCTFVVEAPIDGAQRAEDVLKGRMLQQSSDLRRALINGQPGAPVERGGRHLLAGQAGPVSVVGSEAGALYGPAIDQFARFFILCGEHALFIVDHIRSALPVRTTWNWLLNNRDEGLDLKLFRPDRLVARRGDAGLKLFHLAGGAIGGPVYAHVHDAYHPLPNQNSEGKPGSGMLIRWSERAAQTERVAVHAVAVDHYGAIAGWHLRQFDDGRVGLEAPGGMALWTLALEADPLRLTVTDGESAYRISAESGVWSLDVI